MHNPYFKDKVVPRPGQLGGGEWELWKLTNITVVFGKNGSGKSLLLRAWRDSDPEHSHYVVPERSGEIDYQPHYLQQQISYQERRGNTARNFVDQYRRQIVARIQAYFAVRGSRRKETIPVNPSELEEHVNQLLPDFRIELLGTENPPYRLVRVADGQSVTNIDHLSSGEVQIVMLALDLLTIAAMWEIQETNSRAMLIDEPDAHIHPDLQARFADFLVRTAERYKLQMVISTHSTSLLAALGLFGKEHASVIYLDRTKKAFAAEPFTRIKAELAACLGGHALMGPLFGVPVLLVEGDDDYRIWSQVPRHHVVSFSVIPCNGEEIKKYQSDLERIYAALREDTEIAGFALLDGDKEAPQPNANNPQKHIRFINLACHESENLFLADEVLALLGTDWPAAQAAIVANADKFGNKAPALKEAMTWERKTADVKKFVNEIAQILDPKNVHWTVRVAHAIGRSKPQGQLADFLGERVLSSLWG